ATIWVVGGDLSSRLGGQPSRSARVLQDPLFNKNKESPHERQTHLAAGPRNRPALLPDGPVEPGKPHRRTMDPGANPPRSAILHPPDLGITRSEERRVGK